MRKKFVAVFNKNNVRIMSTMAENAEAARQEIRRELSKPGRKTIKTRWQEDGEKLLEE